MSDLRTLLQLIADENNGRLTPKLVVEAARPPSSPLHSRFEWDNKVAGEAYRRQQASELIQSVMVRHRRADEPDLTIRAFHAIKDEAGYAYHSTDEILEDPLMTRILLADMEREWKQLRARYERFVEFRELVLADLEATG